MKGIEILLGKEIIDIALGHDISINVCIYNRYGKCYIQVSGLDQDMISYCWLESELELNDVIKLEVKEINKSSDLKEKRKIFSKTILAGKEDIKKINKERLERFLVLEKILKYENIL